MKSLMLDHAFRFVERVVFVVGEGNLRSQKALEKIGATLMRREERPGPDGRMAGYVVFGMTRQARCCAGPRFCLATALYPAG